MNAKYNDIILYCVSMFEMNDCIYIIFQKVLRKSLYSVQYDRNYELFQIDFILNGEHVLQKYRLQDISIENNKILLWIDAYLSNGGHLGFCKSGKYHVECRIVKYILSICFLVITLSIINACIYQMGHRYQQPFWKRPPSWMFYILP